MSWPQAIAVCLCFLVILTPIALLWLQKRIDVQAGKAVRRHIEERGFEFLRTTVASAHFGVHFKSRGKKFFARYTYFPKRGISWKGPSPEELVARPEGPGSP